MIFLQFSEPMVSTMERSKNREMEESLQINMLSVEEEGQLQKTRRSARGGEAEKASGVEAR